MLHPTDYERLTRNVLDRVHQLQGEPREVAFKEAAILAQLTLASAVFHAAGVLEANK